MRAYNVSGYSDWVTPAWTVEVTSPEQRIYLPLVLR